MLPSFLPPDHLWPSIRFRLVPLEPHHSDRITRNSGRDGSRLFAATRSGARAGPSGVRRPCSQLRSGATLTPIVRANSACEALSSARTALTSSGLSTAVREGRSTPRPSPPGLPNTGDEFSKRAPFFSKRRILHLNSSRASCRTCARVSLPARSSSRRQHVEGCLDRSLEPCNVPLEPRRTGRIPQRCGRIGSTRLLASIL